MAGSKNNWQDVGRDYRSFLLRCWQEKHLLDEEEPNESSVWRFALVPIDEESSAKGFACLEELFRFLQGQLTQTQDTISEGSPAVESTLSRLEISQRIGENES